MNADVINELDLERLEKNIKIREQIIDAMMLEGKVPEANKDKRLLVEVIDSLDGTILTRAKIKSDDKANASHGDMAKIVAEAISRFSSTIPRVDTQTPTVSKDVVVKNPVPGETDIGIKTEKYQDFMERMNKTSS